MSGRRRAAAQLSVLIARRRVVLLLCALVAVAAAPGLVRLRTDNSPAVFFVRDAPALRDYQRFRADFGGDDALRVVLRGEGLKTAEGLRFVDETERALGALRGVESATGPAAITGGAADAQPAGDHLARLDRLRADPLARALGIATADGAAVSILLALEDPAAHARDAAVGLVAQARELLRAAPAGVDADLVGMPALDVALDDSAAEIYSRSFPLLVLLAVLLLAATYQGWRAVAVALLFVGFCELVLLGVMGYAGVALNLVLAVLPPLLFVIALASAVHVLSRFRALRAAAGADSPAAAAAEAAFADKGSALLWTAASTFAGFGSLAASTVRPVHSLGMWAMAGIALMALAAFTLLPALLVALDGGGAARRPFEAMAERFGCSLAEFAVDHRRLVYAAVAATAAVCAAGLPRLAVESNALHYLAPGHPVRAEFESAERAGIGTAALELVLEAPPGSSFASAAALDRLEALVARLRAESGGLSVVAATDLVGAIDRGLAALPFGGVGGIATDRAVALALLRQSPQGARAAARFLTPDGARARITILVPTAGYRLADPIAQRARALAAAVLPEARAEVTGQYWLLLETQRQLVGTLGSSFAITLGAVALILFLLLRRVRLTLLALVPNVLPVAIVVGVMAWTGVPLDVTTVMVASTTLGLALDDTIHTLIPYRRSVAAGGAGALLGTVEKNAAAYSITGLILGLGFAVCALSSFAPIRRFGALSALAIALAVVADFLLVPALLGGAAKELVGPRRGKAPAGPDGGQV